MAQGIITRLTHERVGVLLSDSPAYKKPIEQGDFPTYFDFYAGSFALFDEYGNILSSGYSSEDNVDNLPPLPENLEAISQLDSKTKYFNATRVQSVEYSFVNQSQDVRAVGYDKFVTRGFQSPVTRSPDVAFSIEYLFAEGKNEIASNLYVGKTYSLFKNFYSLDDKDDINIFVVASNLDKHRDIASITKESDFDGYTVVGIGNAFLVGWSYTAKVGGFPNGSLKYLGSTINFSEYDSQSRPRLPSIKLGKDNQKSEENLILSSEYMAGIGHDLENTGVVFDEFLDPEISAITPGDVKVNISKISGSQGGAKINSIHAAIQSIDLDVNISRQSIYGLGSNFVFDRKLQLPITGNLSMSLILRDFEYNNIDDFFGEANVYSIVVQNRVGLRVLGSQGTDYVIDGFYYVAVFDNIWRRVAFHREVLQKVGIPGQWFVSQDDNYFYVCVGGSEWGRIPLVQSSHDPNIYPGYNPDYEAYVNSYEDLLNHYTNYILPLGTSKSDWGEEHWRSHGRFEKRSVPGIDYVPSFYYESEFVNVWNGINFKKFSVAEVDLTSKEIQNTLNVSQGMNFDISRAQLRSQSHKYSLNGNTMVDVDFFFDVTQEDGLRLYFQ